MAGLFQVLWGCADGGFKQAAVLDGTDHQPLIIPIKGAQDQVENICTRPTAVDWDGDGDLDLVVGNFAGTFYLFNGESGGKFAPKPQAMMAGGSRLKIEGAHSDPFVVDWDNDGDLDLLSGSSAGGVQWAENVAGKGKLPELKSFESVIKPAPEMRPGRLLSEQDLSEPAGSTRIWVDDVNSDGKLDILVGDSVTLVSLAQGVSQDEFAKKSAKWQEAFDAASEAMRKPGNGNEHEAANQRFQKLYQERTKFMREDRTGFVWLYVQK
ncbi:MAG TPA: VCBS repeat-containing protein [Verrucomicrobiae bacterium]|nr:VCBS repeat-containing protein [Verrucomicrobiae bacterium]